MENPEQVYILSHYINSPFAEREKREVLQELFPSLDPHNVDVYKRQASCHVGMEYRTWFLNQGAGRIFLTEELHPAYGSLTVPPCAV